MNVLKLKNGTEELDVFIASTMLVLLDLLDTRPLHMYELVEVCKNPRHTPFGLIGEDLKDLALLSQDGSVHGSIKNIVLSAVEGDGLTMTLVNPVVA